MSQDSGNLGLVFTTQDLLDLVSRVRVHEHLLLSSPCLSWFYTAQTLEGRGPETQEEGIRDVYQRQGTEQAVQAERAKPEDDYGSPAVLRQHLGDIFMAALGRFVLGQGEGEGEPYRDHSSWTSPKPGAVLGPGFHCLMPAFVVIF